MATVNPCPPGFRFTDDGCMRETMYIRHKLNWISTASVLYIQKLHGI